MSPEILTILGMTATLLIATWTMNRSLRADLRADMLRLEDRVDARFEAVDVRFEAFEQKVDARFEAFEQKVDARFEAFEQKVDARFEAFEQKVDARFDSVHSEIHGLREALHGLDKRMARLEGLMQGLREAIVARSVA